MATTEAVLRDPQLFLDGDDSEQGNVEILNMRVTFVTVVGSRMNLKCKKCIFCIKCSGMNKGE